MPDYKPGPGRPVGTNPPAVYTERRQIYFTPAQVATINAARGAQPFSEYVREAALYMAGKNPPITIID